MWSPKPNIVKYTQLLKAAYVAIHAADPQATVITGGTSPAADSADGTHVLPLHWLQGIYANGGKGYFDAVAHHPATYPEPATLIADWSAFQQSQQLYAEMVSQGDGAKKIWGTEIVWPTGTSSQAVSETVQGQRFAAGDRGLARVAVHGTVVPVLAAQLRHQLDRPVPEHGH